MKPTVIYPDRRLQTKLFVSAALFIALVFAWWTIPLAFGLGYGIGNQSAALGLIVTVLLNGGVAVLVFALIPVYYRSIRYEIHEDEVVVHIGVLTRSIKHVPFRTVTNLLVTRGPFDRLFGLGSLAIQTAGMSGQTGAEENLVGLTDVQGVYEQVAGELRRFRGALPPAQAGAEPTPSQPSALVDEQRLLAAILDELRAVRARLEQS